MMEEEIKSLKLEIEVLKKRIVYLEKIENRRKIVKIIKVVAIVIIIIVAAIYGYKLYKEIVNYYNQIQNFMENPLKAFM